jgi:hypothetical protein
MKKRFLLNNILFVILSLSISCKEKRAEPNFSNFVNSFVKDYANLFPDETPLSIDNLKLSNLHIPSDTVLASVDIFIQTYKASFQSFEKAGVTASAEKDLQKVKKILNLVESYSEKSKSGSQFYDVKVGFERIMKSNYAGTDFRLQTLFNKLEYVKDFYEAAKKRLSKLDNATIDNALKQQTETFVFFDETLPKFVNEYHQMTPQYAERLSDAKLAVQDYMAFIESFKMNNDKL